MIVKGLTMWWDYESQNNIIVLELLSYGILTAKLTFHKLISFNQISCYC